MKPSIALCADAASLRHPEMIGLSGENLASQEWLRLLSSANEARDVLREDRGMVEVWVTSCDEVDPINLAAAIKRDRSDLRVCLLASEGSGSLKSRASAANVDVLLTYQAFATRYADAKAHCTAMLACAQSESYSRGGSGIDFLARSQGIGPVGSAGRGRISQDSCTPLLHEGLAEIPCSSRKEPSVFGASQASDHASGNALALQRSSARTLPGRRAFLMPVVSGSGGVGKSTVAALSALFSQGWGYRTLLVDFDLQFGDMRELMGQTDALCIDEALRAPAKLDQLEPKGEFPALLAAPRRLEDAESVANEIPRLLDQVMGRFDVVIANTGTAWGEHHALLLERCSKALFLVDQRVSSLKACQHALDVCERCGIATGPFLFAANRCGKGSLLTSIDVSCALRGAHAVELREGGRDVEDLMSAGLSLDLMGSGSELCASLEQVLSGVLPDCESRVSRWEGAQMSRVERMFGRGRRRMKRGASCRG